MLENLMRAGCFVAIIVLGYILRQINFLKESTFDVLSRIVLKITLPAAIVCNFASAGLDVSLLAVALIGLGANTIYVITGFLTHKRQGRDMQAFGMQNLTGYNIGNFIIPFVQSFLGPAGVITTSIFDVGNSVFSLGGTYGLAALVKENRPFSFKWMGKTLLKAVALDTYVIMVILSLLHVSLPQPVLDLAAIIGNANIFLSMLMLGVGLRLPKDKAQAGKIFKLLGLRYGLATVFSLCVWFLLPLPLVSRQAIVMVLFAPIASASPAFTHELKCDVGLASAANSMSVICSVTIIVALSAFLL